MRNLLLTAVALGLASCAAPSPRYTTAATESSVKPWFSFKSERPVSPSEKGENRQHPEKPSFVKSSKPSKKPTERHTYQVTTVYPDTALLARRDTTEYSAPAPSELRIPAARVVLFDTPEKSDTAADTTFQVEIPVVTQSTDTSALQTPVLDTTAGEGEAVGVASWYGPGLQGKKTSSGERFDMNKMTAAHRSFPFGTIVEVTNLETGQSVKVRVNDRGPHRADRLIDLSKKAAQKIGVTAKGYAKVKIKVIA